MAAEVREFAAVIPAGTPIGAPAVVDIAFPQRIVRSVGWRVPPGPNGHMGWRLSMGGAQVIPTNLGAWVVASDQADDWPLDGLPDSGAWQVTGYNSGAFDHTVYLTFLLDLVSTAGPQATLAAAAELPADLLNIPATAGP
jgi:hypothetical protein